MYFSLCVYLCIVHRLFLFLYFISKEELQHHTLLKSITKDLISDYHDAINFGLQLGLPISSINQKIRDYPRDIEMASYMVALDWWNSSGNSREDKFRSLIESVKSMGKHDVVARLSVAVSNSEDLAEFRSTLENPRELTQLRNVSELHTGSLSIEQNYDGEEHPLVEEEEEEEEDDDDDKEEGENEEDPLLTLRRRERKFMAVSGIKRDLSFDDLNLDYNRLVTFHNSRSVWFSGSEKFPDITEIFGIADDTTHEMDKETGLVNYHTGVVDSQMCLKDKQTRLLNRLRGVTPCLMNVMGDQIGLVNHLKRVVNDLEVGTQYQIRAKDDLNDLVNRLERVTRMRVMYDPTGVVHGEMSGVPAWENNHDNKKAVNQTRGKYQRIFSSGYL